MCVALYVYFRINLFAWLEVGTEMIHEFQSISTEQTDIANPKKIRVHRASSEASRLLLME